MGEVYRARDTRLGRVIALKVLPEHLSDASRRERFQREARAIAALNHPHICTIHDVGHDAGVDFLVMELVDGESFAARLERGPLPLDVAIAVAIEIADGLSSAHRQGIVHRDLKPGNVMLTKAGSGRAQASHAKLLDFGLASMVRAEPLAGASVAPTETAPLTEAGAVLGTLQYMAPEQLEGRSADPRTDVFAFGALLFEMVTGRRAFEGAASANVIAAILRGDTPSVAALLPGAPRALDRLVRTCLEKDPDDRFASMHDVLLQLRWIAAGDEPQQPGPQRQASTALSGWRLTASTAVLVAAASAAGFWAGRSTVTPEPAHAGRLELAVLPFEGRRSFAGAALSPDGQVLAVVAAPEPGMAQFVWIRRLGSPEPERVAGTDGALYPFWSPDGRQLGFFTDDKLKRVAIAEGAAPFDICEVTDGRGGAWFDDGTIVFTDVQGSSLKRVPARGGEPAVVVALDGGSGFARLRYPVRVGQRHVLFLAAAVDTSRSELRLASLDAPGASTFVARSARSAVYANGFLFFDRSGVAMAQHFDEDTGALTGDPFVVTEEVGGEGHVGYRHFMAGGRTIAWWVDPPRLIQLTWLDRAGTATALLGLPAMYGNFALSPDDRTLAVEHQTGGQRDIWVMDVQSGARQQLTNDLWRDSNPRWHPNGTRLAFHSMRGIGGNLNLYSLSIAQPDKVEPLAEAPLQLRLIGWTPSGQFAWQQPVQTVTERLPGPAWLNQRGVMLAAAGAEPRLVNADVASFGQVALSPDGTVLAYSRILASVQQVCVDTFPTPHGCQLLAWSGTEPVSGLLWRADGRELVFRSGDDVIAVPVRTVATAAREKATRLFQARQTIGLAVTRDGKRFLVGVPTTDSLSTITVVPNWTPDGGRAR